MSGDDHGHRATYEASAGAWDAARGPLAHEAAWLDLIAAAIPAGAAALDLGCGSGRPIATGLAARGLKLTGMDFSPRMLALARNHLPGAEWLEGDMRSLDLRRQFHAIIAWDSMFHLTAAEQQAMIPRIAAHLAPGGIFLATVGDHAGEVWGAVSGGPVFHASLSPAGYAAALEDAGLILRRFIAEDPASAGRSILLARKPA